MAAGSRDRAVVFVEGFSSFLRADRPEICPCESSRLQWRLGMSSWQRWVTELEKWPRLNIREWCIYYPQILIVSTFYIIPHHHILYRMCHPFVCLSFWRHSRTFCQRQCSGFTVCLLNRQGNHCKPFSKSNVQFLCLAWGWFKIFRNAKLKVSILIAQMGYQERKSGWSFEKHLEWHWLGQDALPMNESS